MSARHAQPTERPLCLPILQPEPIEVRFAYLRHEGGTATALYRGWYNGDAALCRLCPAGRCSAVNGACLILVNMLIPGDQLRMFSTVGLAGGRVCGVVEPLPSGPLDGRGVQVTHAEVAPHEGQEAAGLLFVQGHRCIAKDELHLAAPAGGVAFDLNNHVQAIEVDHPRVDPQEVHRVPSG